MAINRAPFNALIDDDGSNTIGTPWNKSAIATTILDPVDAALAAGGQHWLELLFNANYFNAKPPMTWVLTSSANTTINWYAVTGGVLLWNLAVEASTVGGTPSNELWATTPNTVVAARKAWGLARLYQVAGGWVDAEAIANVGDNVVRISRKDGSNLSLDTTTYVHFQIMVPI